jgi:hypothetical protein
MTNTELKGVLGERAFNLEQDLKRLRSTRILMEADLQTARLAEAEVEGQLTATKQALREVDAKFVPPAPPSSKP